MDCGILIYQMNLKETVECHEKEEQRKRYKNVLLNIGKTKIRNKKKITHLSIDSISDLNYKKS